MNCCGDALYWCYASGSLECRIHGGFETCCDEPESHVSLARFEEEWRAERDAHRAEGITSDAFRRKYRPFEELVVRCESCGTTQAGCRLTFDATGTVCCDDCPHTPSVEQVERARRLIRAVGGADAVAGPAGGTEVSRRRTYIGATENPFMAERRRRIAEEEPNDDPRRTCFNCGEAPAPGSWWCPRHEGNLEPVPDRDIATGSFMKWSFYWDRPAPPPPPIPLRDRHDG